MNHDALPPRSPYGAIAFRNELNLRSKDHGDELLGSKVPRDHTTSSSAT